MSRAITVEDVYHLKFLKAPRVSPDGQRIAFVITTIDERTYDYRSAIWMVDTAGGEAKRFVGGAANAHSPSWSPDGRWLAFISDRAGEAVGKDEKEQKKRGKGKPQLWLMPTDGGEAFQLTFMPHGVSDPWWSPDSTQLLFSAQVGPLDEETSEGKVLPKARVIDRLWYRLDGVGYIYERRQHLFLVSVAGGEPEQLTDGDWDDSDAAWSPDGSAIAFTSSRAEDRWRSPTPDLYTLSIEQGKAGSLRCLTDGSLACSSPAWASTGKTLAFVGTLKLRSAGHQSLYSIGTDVEQGSAVCLTQHFEGTCMDWTNSDIGDEHLIPRPVWSLDGQLLYVLAAVRGATRLYAVLASGAEAQPVTLTPGNVHVRDFSVDAAGKQVALLSADATHVQEIFTFATSSPGDVQRLTNFNTQLFEELVLSTPEHMPYTGADGWPMDGWIIKPQNFDPARKYPLVVEIHGGPHTQYGYGFFHEMQLLAAAGYVVLYTNPRGSCGYGYDFALAVRGAWGEKDSLDIMAGVDALLQKGYIDEGRMGVTGGSYGGFMTNWLIGHNDRFKAAVTDRSVVNLASDFGSSDAGWMLADDEFESTPWESRERYLHMSPIYYAKDMHTPLLILHSEQDLRCNIEQAEQLFATLKYLGREVLFVRFEGQSHGLSRGGHPKLRVERLQHILGWFEKHL